MKVLCLEIPQSSAILNTNAHKRNTAAKAPPNIPITKAIKVIPATKTHGLLRIASFFKNQFAKKSVIPASSKAPANSISTNTIKNCGLPKPAAILPTAV